jgi:protein-L-isoaspartate(D-aspartate) O-methyltransferase
MGRARTLSLALALVALTVTGAAHGADNLFDQMRHAMVARIIANAQTVQRTSGLKPPSQAVLDAIAKVPRHDFVPKKLRIIAYIDGPLPLGHGQSISQPYLIALMLDLARIKPTDTVFETGTGLGYQAAVLSLLARKVVSVEVVAPLGRAAAAILQHLGYTNVETHIADGYYGWKASAPYDVIIVKEAVGHIPPPLLKQLKRGGRMVIPLGPKAGPQYLTLIEKGLDGKIKETKVLPVRFTPLQGGERI